MPPSLRDYSILRPESGICSTDSAQLHACGYGLTPTCRELYRRRDFAFALATTANGGATVIRTSVKIITKPNMICLAFFGFSVEQDKDGALKGR